MDHRQGRQRQRQESLEIVALDCFEFSELSLSNKPIFSGLPLVNDVIDCRRFLSCSNLMSEPLQTWLDASLFLVRTRIRESESCVESQHSTV